ncbi:MAG: sulfur carrier protein ThiS [Nocardioidaceae bacterium]|nr:sulfur carrier protein ThiS [Nocardioidaceae bacterium]
MRIQVNGTPRDIDDGCTLATLVPRHQGVACAVNGAVVRDWELVVLREGDAVEVLTAFQGG